MGETAYDPMSYAWRVLLVLALVFLAAFWVRTRWRGTGRTGDRGRRLHVVDSLSLGPQRHVHVIEADGRKYLIGVTPQQITLLASLEGPPEGEFGGAGGGSDGPVDFQTVLEKSDGTRSGEDSAT